MPPIQIGILLPNEHIYYLSFVIIYLFYLVNITTIIDLWWWILLYDNLNTSSSVHYYIAILWSSICIDLGICIDLLTITIHGVHTSRLIQFDKFSMHIINFIIGKDKYVYILNLIPIYLMHAFILLSQFNKTLVMLFNCYITTIFICVIPITMYIYLS